MKENPFKEYGFKTSYTDFVCSQIKSLDIGDSVQAELGGKEPEDFRATMRYAAKKMSRKFATKTAKDGALWVKRIS